MVINIHDIDIEVRAAVINQAADEFVQGVDVTDVDADTVATLFAVQMLRDYAYTLIVRHADTLTRALVTAEQTARTQIAADQREYRNLNDGQPMIGAHRPD